jgi:hypothetical protein
MLLLWGPKSIRLTTPKVNSHPGLITLMVPTSPVGFDSKKNRSARTTHGTPRR